MSQDRITWATRIFAVLMGPIVLGGIGGCASVESTAAFYMPYTMKVYLPKPPDAPIPVLGREPKAPHVAIGRLAFETDLGWDFLRKSMIYNARVNGADAVVLKEANTRQQLNQITVPPRIDWVPISNYWSCDGRSGGYTNWVPFYRPGYVRQYLDQITGIDAEMIVLKK